MKINLFFSIFILTISQFAQNGRVIGVIKDAEFNDVLPFSNVQVKGTTIGITSDLDGAYELSLTPGKHTLIFSYLGYQNQEVEGVEVQSNKTTEINITLQPSSNQLQEVVVSVTTLKNTESSLLKYQRQSVQVMNGISIEGLQKTGASNVAAAVKSIPGVSVQGDKYVYVRGLGDRYTKTMLNDIDIPGLDPDRNTVQMDIFPSNILDNIQVVKTATSDLDADFTGGVVNIITKDFPSNKTSSFGISSTFSPDAHFNKDFLTYQGSSTDFLGFDNGLRKMPIDRGTYIPAPFEQNAELTKITQSFNPVLSAQQKSTIPDFSLNFSYGNQKNVGSNKLGFLMAFGYRAYSDFDEHIERGNYRKYEESNLYQLYYTTLQTAQLGTKGVLLNGLLGLSYKTNNSKYGLNILHIQNGESTASKGHKFEYFSNNIEIYSDYLDYNQRSITNLQLSGKHATASDWTIDWMLSPTYSSIHDKDVRFTPFEYVPETNQLQITQSGGGLPQRIWRGLNELNSVAKIDFIKKHQLWQSDAKMKFGAKFIFKNREYGIDQYGIKLYNTNGSQFDGNANIILTDESIWKIGESQGVHVVGNYQPTNTFNAFNTNIATYFSEEFNLSPKLKSIVGLRVEKFDQYYDGQNNMGTILLKNEKTIDDLGFYPSLNLILNTNDKTNWRFSYYISTARPSFKETSIAQIYDPLSNLTYNGNLNLKPSKIQNLDLKYEFYNKEDHIIALSGFYKNFKNPIELVFYSASQPGNTQHRNVGKATIYGAEFELRQGLDLVSPIMENFEVNVNFSYIISQQEMDKSPNGEYESKLNTLREGEKMSDTRALQGQSPYLINAGLSYKNLKKAWQANLAYNVQGKTLEVVGISVIPDVYTLPFNSLNFNLNKGLGKEQKSSVKLQINNLLNEKKVSVFQSYKAEDQIFNSRNVGMSFGLSYNYKF